MLATQRGQPATSNRITDTGYAYDASGNMTNDTFHTYTYDAENRIKTVDGTGATYSYLGPRRVQRVYAGVTVVYVYSSSKVIAVYADGAPDGEYVYAGSTLLVSLDNNGGTPIYHHFDHLSERVLTGPVGELEWTAGDYPFGEAWYQSAGNDAWRFTSYLRDSESGLDYAIFRHYSNRLGRFMSPDKLGGTILKPQSLNLYTYVQNDPCNYVDPLGLVIAVPPPKPPPPPLVFPPGAGVIEIPIGPIEVIYGGGHRGGGGKLPKCKNLNLNNPTVFWDDQFATPEQVAAFFQQSNAPGSWDGSAAASAFIAAGINPGLAVGIIGAETSFGNSGLTGRNVSDPFSSGGGSFDSSLSLGLGAVISIEDTTFTDNTPLSALENRQNARFGYNRRGQAVPGQYDKGGPSEQRHWTSGVNSWFQKLAKFLGKCK